VAHTRYDMLSFIRTLEISIGMKPLGLADSLAVPLYDAFNGTAQNAIPIRRSGRTSRSTSATPRARPEPQLRSA
jgi:hypothetical protein